MPFVPTPETEALKAAYKAAASPEEKAAIKAQLRALVSQAPLGPQVGPEPQPPPEVPLPRPVAPAPAQTPQAAFVPTPQTEALKAAYKAAASPEEKAAIKAQLRALVYQAPSPQPVEPAQRVRMQDAARDVGQALQGVDFRKVSQAGFDAGKLRPQDRAAAAGKITAAEAGGKQLVRQAAILAQDLRRAGDTDRAAELEKAINIATNPTLSAKVIADAAGPYWHGLMRALDYPRSRIAAVTLGEEFSSQEAAEAELKRRKDQPWKYPLSAAYYYGAGALGAPLGAAGGALAAGAGVGLDLLSGERPSRDAAGEAFLGGVKAGGGVMRAAGMDPLMYLGGVGGVGKTSGNVAYRLAIRAGKTAAEARKIGAAAARVAGAESPAILNAVPGTQPRTQAFESALRYLVGQGIPEADILKAYGPRGEFFQAGGQLAVGLPMGDLAVGAGRLAQRVGSKLSGAGSTVTRAGPAGTTTTWVGRRLGGQAISTAGKALEAVGGAVGVELGPQLAKIPVVGKLVPGAGEHLGRRAFGAVAQKIGTDVYDPVRVATKMEALKARGTQTERMNDILGRLGVLAEKAPMDAARRKELVSKVIDAPYRLVPVDPGRGASIVHVPGARTIVEHEGQFWAVVPEARAPLASRVTAAERAWMDDMQALTNDLHKELVAAGVLKKGQKAKNLLTGRYFPRIYDSAHGALDELSEVAEMASRGSSSMRSRTGIAHGGFPLGHVESETGVITSAHPAWYMKGKADPHEVLAMYAGQASRAIAKKQMERWLISDVSVPVPKGGVPGLDRHWVEIGETGRMVPAPIHNLFVNALGRPGSLSHWLKRNTTLETTAAGRGAIELVRFWEGGISELKRNVLMRNPGYHLVNRGNAAFEMLRAGMDRPLGWVKMARKIMDPKTRGSVVLPTPSGPVSGHTLWRTMQERNLGHQILGVETGGGTKGAVLRQNRIAKEAATGKKAWLARGRELWHDLGQRANAQFDDETKIAVALHRLSQGDPADVAVRVALDVMRDPGDRSRLTNFVNHVMPFGTWFTQAPVAVARAAAKRPGVLSMPDRVARAILPQQPGDENTRKDIDDRGPSYVVHSPLARKRVSQVMKLMGGSGLRPEETFRISSRDPTVEPFVPFLEVGRGNPFPLGLQLGPASKAVVENLAGKDLTTREDMTPNLAPWRMFPSHMQALGVPEWMTAKSGQNPGASRYLPGMLPAGLGTPLGVWLANKQIGQALGPVTGPPATFGYLKKMASDPQNIWAHQLWSLLSRYPGWTTGPMNQLSPMLHGAALDQATKSWADYSKAQKLLNAQRAAGR